MQIDQWYEEVESASKGRRVIFREIMTLLKHRKSLGLIIHKIDRGARSLRDWADIGDLIDAGIEVCFAHDDLDLNTRGGRLTADIQAVIAADYIRNLREEVRKGIQGRLNQGLYPFRAPTGYRDRGGGRVKTPDPVYAPLLVEAFRRYATGRYTLSSLANEMAILGLTNAQGGAITPHTLSKMLRSHFYVGEFCVRGVTYLGQHQPLVTRTLFNQVQGILRKRRMRRRNRHSFLYSRRLVCGKCSYHLIGETQKGRVYYRCHNCHGVCVREDRIGSSESMQNPRSTLTEPIHVQLEPFEKFDSP